MLSYYKQKENREKCSRTGIYAPFSGRGDTRIYRAQKPDLAAPGVGIMAPDRDGGYSPVTGTSFAAPLVTGAAALLMEWGIVRENDRYLYGEKVKAYLRKGAKRLSSEQVYPNPRLGYGEDVIIRLQLKKVSKIKCFRSFS